MMFWLGAEGEKQDDLEIAMAALKRIFDQNPRDDHPAMIAARALDLIDPVQGNSNGKA